MGAEDIKREGPVPSSFRQRLTLSPQPMMIDLHPCFQQHPASFHLARVESADNGSRLCVPHVDLLVVPCAHKSPPVVAESHVPYAL